MTALQDWLSFRPVDQNAIMEMVCRPFRAALSPLNAADEAEQSEEPRLLRPGVERC